MLCAFGGTLPALWTVSLVLPFESWGRAVLLLSFIFTGAVAAQLQIDLHKGAAQQEQRSVITQSCHYINSGTGSLTFICQRKAITFSLSNLLQYSLFLNSLITSYYFHQHIITTSSYITIVYSAVVNSVWDRDQKMQFHEYPLQEH